MSLTFEGDGTITGFDAGLSGFGGLVAVKHAIKTDVFSASVTSGSNTSITGLSITHSLSDAANKLFLIGYVGLASNSGTYNETAISFADNGVLVGIADIAGSRSRTAAGASFSDAASNIEARVLTCNLLYEPGDTASHTYTLNAINVRSSTATVYINRNARDLDAIGEPRSASSIVLMEVAV